MIENIRKYTGLMIVVLVLLFVGLIFLGDNVKNSFGSKPVMEIDGQGVSQKEFSRNMAVIDLPRALSFAPLPRQSRVLASHYLGDSVIDYQQLSPGSVVGQMSQFLQASQNSPDRFITNRLNIQKAGLEYGVTPSNLEVESFVENVLFAKPEGGYDQEAYSDFIKNDVTRFGGTKGFNEYIRDLLTAQNLSKLLGGGIIPEMETIRSLYDSQKQTITAEQITLEPGGYEAKVNPTEEQLLAFYEENKANYMSDELRSVSYINIQPDWDATLKTVTAEKAEAAKIAEEARLKQEEATKKAQAEAAKANAANATDAANAANAAQTPDAMPPTEPTPAPTEAVVEEIVPAEAKALVTKLKAMAVYFDSASAAIKASEEEKIAEAAQLILASNDVQQSLTVGGYADLQGNADFNRDLSLKRANAVRDQLIAKGVPAARLTVNHFGEDTSKSAKDDLWKSRRVEISLTGPTKKADPAETGAQGDPGDLGEQAPAPAEPAAAVQPAAPVAKPAPVTPAPPKSAKDQLTTAEKTKAVEALNPTVTEFFDNLVTEDLGKDFEGISKRNNYTVLTTELFAKSSPPQELAKAIKDSQLGSLANSTFQLHIDGDADQKLSDPHQTTDGWFILRLDAVQESVQLSYEEAKVRVTVDLKKKLAREMMAKEAQELHEKLTAAMKEGKTFAEAAKEADQTVETKANLVTGQIYQGNYYGDRAFLAAQFTNPGEIAPLKLEPSEEQPDSALIVYVNKREVLKDDQYNTQLERTFDNLSQQSRLVAFDNWLNDRYNESGVVPPVLNNDQ